MAQNYISTGEIVEFVSPTGGVNSGDGVLSGNLFGVSMGTYAETAKGQMSVVGVFTLPKLSTDAFTKFQRVFWDGTNGRLTDSATGNYPVGVALEPAENGDTTAIVRLDGVSTSVSA